MINHGFIEHDMLGSLDGLGVNHIIVHDVLEGLREASEVSLSGQRGRAGKAKTRQPNTQRELRSGRFCEQIS
jgi:hypothetical protein